MTTPDVNCCESNYIKDTVMKIDRLQKEIVVDSSNSCISCETSLLTSAYNTIPVSFRGCCSYAVLGNLGSTTDNLTTQFFRIESVRQCRFVTLRLLSIDGAELTATNYTMILDLDFVTTMQCYGPISVPLCTDQNF